MKLDIYYNYIKMLNSDLKNSLTFYTSDYYKEINSKENYINNEIKNHMDNIQTVFEGAPTMNQTITVYRGMKKEYKDDKITTFISTSKSKDQARKFMSNNCCMYIITLTPGNYSILPLEDVSEHPDEEEILLPSGLISIQKRDKDEKGYDVFYCTYIPEDSEIFNTNQIKEINKLFLKDKINLSFDTWINRILESGIKDEIETLCESDSEDFENCIHDLLKTLDYYEDIPDDVKNKFLQLFKNINENII